MVASCATQAAVEDFYRRARREVFDGGKIRDDNWKLVIHRGNAAKNSAKVEPDRVELFDLVKDSNESTDLAAKMPIQLAALRAKLAEVSLAYRDSVAKD